MDRTQVHVAETLDASSPDPGTRHNDNADTLPGFRALAHHFGVRSDDPELLHYVDEVLSPLAAPGAPPAWYDLSRREGDYTLAFDGAVIVSTGDPAHALAMLFWHVNRQAVERSRDFVRLHAAAASLDGQAVLLPADMEAGKTTLVAGLVRFGFDYLTDEVAALDPDSLDVFAYPKALSVDEGSWHVLPELCPGGGTLDYSPKQWQVPADCIRDNAITSRAHPRFLVFPRYVVGATSRLAPLGRADATVRLARCTFGLEDDPRRDLPVLARLAARATSYDLQVGDLAAACRLLLELYGHTDE